MDPARLSRVAAVAFAATASLAGIRAEAACAPIEHVPFIVSTPGTYCLAQDISSPYELSEFIWIQADNVTIDLAGHTLDGQSRSLYGVYGWDRRNVTVRGGRLLGFAMGVFLGAATSSADALGGHRIEDLELRGIEGIGINVWGRGNLVQRNRIADTGTGLEVNTAEGIRVAGPSARVLDNEVIRTRGVAAGIRVVNAPGTIVSGNRISETVGISPTESIAIAVGSSANTQIQGNQISNVTSYARSTGVLVLSSSYVIVRDNSFSFLDRGVVFGSSAATGKYIGNVTSGVNVPYSGGTAAGATNY
jgi:hypothetical protein